MHARIVALPVIALLLIVLPGLSRADGPYISGRLGYTVVEDSNAGLLGDVELENSFVLGAAYGHEFDRGYALYRLEGELSYRLNQVDEAEFLGNTRNADGRVHVLALLADLVVAVHTGTRVQPYLLAGLGGAWTTVSDAEVQDVEVVPGEPRRDLTVVDDSRLQVAYQLGAGLEFELTPQMQVTADYRYFSTSKDTFEDEADGNFEYRYSTHEVSLGLRYRF